MGTTLGLGSPFGVPTLPLTTYGLSPYSGVGINPFLMQPSAIGGPQAMQQHPIQKVLQIVPQQIQHLLQLQYQQQQQVQQLQQVLQVILAQLAQQQQLQLAAQHASQLQQPFGTTGAPVFSPWGVSPQIGAQPGYVM